MQPPREEALVLALAVGEVELTLVDRIYYYIQSFHLYII